MRCGLLNENTFELGERFGCCLPMREIMNGDALRFEGLPKRLLGCLADIGIVACSVENPCALVPNESDVALLDQSPISAPPTAS